MTGSGASALQPASRLPVIWIKISKRFGWTGYTKPMLRLDRFQFTNASTIGKLYFRNKFLCYTIEDTVRAVGVKIYGSTAIPVGTYRVILTKSVRLGTRYGWPLLPELLSVPGFVGIRIHPFNVAGESAGCIGTGLTYSDDIIFDARKAFNLLMPKLIKFLSEDKLYIMIAGGK